MTLLIVVIARYLIIIVGLIAVVSIIFSEKTVRGSIIKLAVLSFLIAFLIGYIAGIFYYDTRPFVAGHTTPLIPHQPDNGFPSDHILAAMAAAATIFVYKRKLGISLGRLGVAVGVARIAAQLRHPIDIVGSIVIAIAATYLARLMLKKLDRRFRHSP